MAADTKLLIDFLPPLGGWAGSRSSSSERKTVATDSKWFEVT
jgi:hypothetical protein